MTKEIYFNKNIKYLTDNTIITQAELSRILGVSRQAIHNLINKNADCRLSTIMKVSEVYNIDPSEILFVDLEEKYKDNKLNYKKNLSFIKDDGNGDA
ncbi:MAG: helix-turn-helix transcriptional regulator [Acholeplasmatales bacterium]|nr:helix-turn-helix transcriptional regulator [Acholeplasmatales bacterium]